MISTTSPKRGGFSGCAPREDVGEIAEQPRPAEAAAADDDAVAAGLPHHAQRVPGLPDVAVAEHRDRVDGLLELGDRVPVGLAVVELGGGARVQRDRRAALVLGDAAGVEVGLTAVVDARCGT